MIVRKVTIGELLDFVKSEEYLALCPKPISPLRAVSQAKNPAGQTDDVALIFVSEEDRLIAFAGLLPDELADAPEPVYSNSGWWVHPELGRKYALSVFLNALQSCNRRMFLTDCTEYTKSILEKTGLFHFQTPMTGERFIFRFYLDNYFKSKSKYQFVSGLFSMLDGLGNMLISYRIKNWRKKYLPAGFTVGLQSEAGSELNEFIRTYSADYILKQDTDKLNWIVQNKWMTDNMDSLLVDYPFSQYVQSFRQEFLVIHKNSKVVALFLLSWRNHHVSIPYSYFNDKHLSDIVILLIDYLLKRKANSLVVFNPKLLPVVDQLNIPIIKRFNIVRHSGYTNELKELFDGKRFFQDGEGDAAFT
ncbi:MAG TPA: hypothetical protein VFD91_10155 [Mariniphaga sp.]|nr:hypothetical protein [Mariniphaga sp.]